MSNTMKTTQKILKESISQSAITPLSYIVFIDAADASSKVRGYIKMIFPSESPGVVKSWFRKLIISKEYAKSKDNMQAIQARFSNNPSLKSLMQSIEKIKSMQYTPEEKKTHENDIRTLIDKTSIYIKRRLSEEDIKLLESVLSDINAVAEKISTKIDNEVALLMVKPTEEPKQSKKTEKKPKKESVIGERLRNKFRKKIKEIVRTHLLNNK